MANENLVMVVITAARPTFLNNSDKVAFAVLVHAYFMASGYKLIATGPPAFSDSSLSSSDEVGIDRWNELGYSSLSSTPTQKEVSRYSLNVSSSTTSCASTWLLQVLPSNYLHLEINVADYVGEGGTNCSSHVKNLETLVKILDAQLLSKLDGSSQPGVIYRTVS